MVSHLSQHLCFFLHNNVPYFFRLRRAEGACPQPSSLHGFTQRIAGLMGPQALLPVLGEITGRLSSVSFYSSSQVWRGGGVFTLWSVDTEKGGHHWRWEWGQGCSQGLGEFSPVTRAGK